MPPTKPTTKIKLGYLFVVVVISITFSVGLVECVLRLKNASMKNYDIEMWKYAKELKFPSPNPKLGHEHRTLASANLQSVLLRTNEWGLRGGPLREPKPKRRILFLGSSITFGWGVAEEETTPSVIQNMFQRDHQDVEVLNGGIGNYNSERYVELFLTKLKELKPTDLVVQYFLRDAENLEQGRGNWFLMKSQLAVTLWNVSVRFIPSGSGKSLEDHYRNVYEPTNSGYQKMVVALTRLRDYCKENHIRLYLAMTPDVHNLKNYPFHYIHQNIKDLSSRLGYEYVDLYPELSNFEPSQIWSMPGDPHPNALGHRKMAEQLFPILLKTE